MDKLTYRELTKKDYERVKELICDAFGFGEFIEDKKFLDSILNIYLHSCILDSSFSKVAVKDNKVIGVILGSAKKDKKRLPKSHSILVTASAFLKIMISSKENKKLFKEFIKIQDIYKEIIQGKQDSFQGCVQLFIVSEESRGLGVGKTLINYLSNYMQSMEVDSMYLYTDTRCNYGFYDSQNFKRLNEKEIYLDSIQEKLNIFLYGYDFN
ncbi:GNAT family acetyltransferase [Lysinibacillus contaminans]|uniref:GNAT family acetyltransferase n=1 Tax=Lysinibacillus contaminans TaxID=1293441 RepID=A0ABR5JZ51_9BACI|nr:GNAT family N-acetyltransferase [Lysinibacillus contaminans]KOS67779.1 GNAT family acetyltransferase [Lysinibacillus contaminans]